jgi:hypothetical protein
MPCRLHALFGDCTEIKGPMLWPLGYLTVQDLSLAHHLEMPARQEPLPTDGLSKQGAIHARERTQQIGVHRTRVYLRHDVLQICRCVYYPTRSFLSIENRPLTVFMPTSCGARRWFAVGRRGESSQRMGKVDDRLQAARQASPEVQPTNQDRPGGRWDLFGT